MTRRPHRKPLAERYQTVIASGVVLALIAGVIYVLGVIYPPTPFASSPQISAKEKPR